MFSLVLNIVIAFISASVIVFFPQSKSDLKERLDLIPPPKSLEHFTFGYNETFSDSLWLRAIQDLGVCENVEGGNANAPELNGKYRNQAACKKGWVFQMLDIITDLTPKFRMPYIMGASTLSVMVDDRDGATAMFEKGLKEFPDDWELAYDAAYHYSYEVKNPKRAAELLVLAGEKGAPHWVFSLAGKLYTEAGQAQLAKSVLEDELKKLPNDEQFRKRLEQRLKEVNEVLAKSQ